jgi:hypothetical protein
MNEDSAALARVVGKQMAIYISNICLQSTYPLSVWNPSDLTKRHQKMSSRSGTFSPRLCNHLYKLWTSICRAGLGYYKRYLVFTTCRPAILKGQEGSGLPFTACSEALKKTDIDGICKHLDEVCGQTNDTDKLISCTRACHGECSKKHGN